MLLGNRFPLLDRSTSLRVEEKEGGWIPSVCDPPFRKNASINVKR